MRTMLDAAVLPATLPEVDACAGYLSSPGTQYQWSPDEWARAKAHARYFLPIWVAAADQSESAGTAAGESAANEANDLQVPKGCAIALDVEEHLADQLFADGYVAAWCVAVRAAGFAPIVYTSLARAAQVEPIAPLWGANWNDQPDLPDGVIAHQYQGGQGHAFDLSVVSDSLHLAPSDPSEAPMPAPGPAPILGTFVVLDGAGYYQCDEEGHVWAFGDAKYHGSPMDPHVPHARITGFSAAADGSGYVLTDEPGGAFCYGSVKYKGHVVGGVAQLPD